MIQRRFSNVKVMDTERCPCIEAGAGEGGNNLPMVLAYGFDPGATRDVGLLFLPEVSKTLTNGTCPGHHNGVVLVCGITTKGNGDAFVTPDRHTSLTIGGGQAGQGYPCILEVKENGVFDLGTSSE